MTCETIINLCRLSGADYFKIALFSIFADRRPIIWGFCEIIAHQWKSSVKIHLQQGLGIVIFGKKLFPMPEKLQLRYINARFLGGKSAKISDGLFIFYPDFRRANELFFERSMRFEDFDWAYLTSITLGGYSLPFFKLIKIWLPALEAAGRNKAVKLVRSPLRYYIYLIRKPTHFLLAAVQ